MNPDWTTMNHLDGRNFLTNTYAPNASWLNTYIPPEDQQPVQQAIQQAIASKTVFQSEHRVIKANGAIGWVFSRAVPITNREGDITEWFGAASDITEKKSLFIQLEEMVNERTKDLQRSNEDLQQFAHVASHDLKEPVRKIRTFGLRLRDELNDTLNERSRNYTNKILESASRMSTMIDGVLTYSSLNGAEQKMELIDLNKVITDIKNDLEVLIEEKGAVVHHNNMPQIEGVQVLIYQLFYNLINNALKFSKEDVKPVVSINNSPTCIDGLPFVRITVTDNGIGFSPEYNEKIFNTFTRLNSKVKFDGTGLGLSLSRKIAERHKGSISAEGREDGGAVFTVMLPVAG